MGIEENQLLNPARVLGFKMSQAKINVCVCVCVCEERERERERFTFDNFRNN